MSGSKALEYVTDIHDDLNFHSQRRRFLTPPNYAARPFSITYRTIVRHITRILRQVPTPADSLPAHFEDSSS